MKKPNKSDFDMSTSRGRKDYRMSVAKWKRTQPKVKKPSWTERLDAKRTASDKERKSRNPEQLKVSYNKKTRKVERTIEDNPNYERPTEGQRGYSKDTNPSQGAAVDMDKVKDAAKQSAELKKDLKINKQDGDGEKLSSTNEKTKTPKDTGGTSAADRKAWLEKTKNSPAGKAWGDSKEWNTKRWNLQKNKRLKDAAKQSAKLKKLAEAERLRKLALQQQKLQINK